MKKKIISVLTLCFIVFCSLGIPMSAQAENLGYSPLVYDTKSNVYGPTFQVNQFSGCICGLSVLSPRDQVIRDMGGFTDEQWRLGAEPILYVNDHYTTDSEERLLIDKTLAEFGGTVVCALDIQLFKFTGTWNEPVHEVANPLELILGIPSSANYTELWNNAELLGWEFAMIRVHDNNAEILRDKDNDIRTLTFDTDKFSIYALFYAPKENIDAYLAQQTSTSTDAPKDEYDKVPKMGDSFFDSFVTFGQGRRR